MGKKVVEKVVKRFVKRHLLTGFTLVEILIVVAILGILAAITIPAFQDYVQQSKESAAKANLRIVREAINRYAAEHDGVPPGYQNNNPSGASSWVIFWIQLIRDGQYINDVPTNPINDKNTITLINNATPLPNNADGTTGWMYKPSNKAFKLNATGTDSQGTDYYDY